MTGQDIKNSILQVAIQGKLVPQDANDEPASELLKRIRKEKEQLIKDKKIKKEKPLPEIKEEDKPFEIPETWEWCRLQTLCQIEDGEKKEGNYICMDAKYLRGKSTGDTLNKGKYVERGEKIILVDGENSGEVFTCPIDGYMGSTFKKLWISGMIFEPFIIYLLRFHKDMFRNSKKGAAIPHLNKDIFRELLVPLPPLAEQHRIVEKIEFLMPKVEKYDRAEKRLSKLNKELPEQLKQSILQETIMGKLGTQDPNDEPASELLKRIRKEKEQLIKDKKIKKEKPLPEIKEEDKPFDIPETWEWCRLQTLCQIEDGEKKEGNYICMDAKYLRGKSTGDTLNKGKYVERGEKIILVDGENSGEVFTCPIDGYMGSTFKKLWISGMIFEPFIIYLLRFHKDMFRNSKKGAAIPHLNKDIFRELLVPLPPLAEQHRIVEKVEALLGKIERIKK